MTEKLAYYPLLRRRIPMPVFWVQRPRGWTERPPPVLGVLPQRPLPEWAAYPSRRLHAAVSPP